MTTQPNSYKVIYSDGVKVLDIIFAANLKEAKKIAAERASTYKTAYYKVARCYNGGVLGSAGANHWH
jgi:hypothetical protein